VSVSGLFDFDTSLLRARLRCCFEINHEADQLNRFQFDSRLAPAVNKLVFGDEATFYLSVRVNRHSLRVWGSENRHESFQR
jgi:hypothetical protein